MEKTIMLLKDFTCCYKCKYGWLPKEMEFFFENRPMCLYYHNTGKHRINDEYHCKTFLEKV